jgi:SAM-dependent methyltransferase
MRCRHCRDPLVSTFVDLGSSPPSNAYLTADRLAGPETWYPLRVMVCDNCRLVQTEDFAAAEELFDAEYAYFSGFSRSWVAHCERYASEMTDRFDLDAGSQVVEVASNDGTLLRFFREQGMRCTGIEPTAGTASAARRLGLEVIEEFLTGELADRLVGGGLSADLLVANNVVAHVPDIDGFVAACRRVLMPAGVATFEFAYLVRLVEEAQFDTIYHEHFSYLSLTAFQSITISAGLEIFDVEELPTHGGSLRVFVQVAGTGIQTVSSAVSAMLASEAATGVTGSPFYAGFQERADGIKDGLLRFLLDARRDGRSVMGYGAAAKGNTLLNYAGIRSDLLRSVVDRNPAKQGRFLPGSRVPIVEEGELRHIRPDHVLILPWNLRDEIADQLSYVCDWGATFVTAVPELAVW